MTGQFRPGLPSIDDVRKHERHGGAWMFSVPRLGLGVDTVALHAVAHGIVANFGDGWRVLDLDSDHSHILHRPIDRYGYALPWPDEVPKMANEEPHL
jgi:hypothetical protein